MKNQILAAVSILLILTGACARKAEILPATARGPTSVTTVSQTLSTVSPSIVRTAKMDLIAEDVEKAAAALTRLAESSGGHLSTSSQWHEKNQQRRARLTIQVPAGELDRFLAAVRKLVVRVQQETVSTEDVSQEQTDLASQIKNLRLTEVELRELLKTVRIRSSKADEILKVHSELVRIRGELERTQGRMEYLRHITSMSEVRIEILPDSQARPMIERDWLLLTVAKSALRALLATTHGIAVAAVWITLYLLPLAAVFAAALAAIRAARRKLRTVYTDRHQ